MKIYNGYNRLNENYSLLTDDYEYKMATLYPEVKRTILPHEYYVDGTKDYVDFKNKLIEETKRKIDFEYLI